MYLISDGGLICNTLDTIESIMLTKNKDLIDGIKLDVRKTIDNIYVLSKYDDLSILTCSKKLVCKEKYNYIKKVKFPSHIFKYYIPTLEEILIKYNKNKVIVLELFQSNIDGLYDLLSKYNYKYYFFSKDNNILIKLKKDGFNKLGTIINNNDIIVPIINKYLYSNIFLLRK